VDTDRAVTAATQVPAEKNRGRLPVSNRAALTGILFVLKGGLRWRDLPAEMGCGSGVTCWRRLRAWQATGVWDRLLKLLLAKLRAADQIDFLRAAVDSSSIRAVGATQKLAVSRERLEAIHRVLRERAVATALFPFAAAESGNRVDRVVTPCRARRVRGPMSRAFARRNRECCVARGDRGIAGFGIVVTVGDTLMRHQRGPHVTGIRVEPEMRPAPRATLRKPC